MTGAPDMTPEELTAFLESLPATVPSDLRFTYRGIGDDAYCQGVTRAAGAWVFMFSKFAPLQGLESVTFAADYAQALQELDRGVQTSRVLTPTEEDFGRGAAMAPAVIRDGKVKTCVFLHSDFAHLLVGEDEDGRQMAIHTLVHELGHVAEHQLMEDRLPGVMLKPFDDPYEGALFDIGHAAWSEYYASRVSAHYGLDSMLGGYREMFEAQLNRMIERVEDARQTYRDTQSQDNANAAASVIQAEIGQTMKFAGYLIGHADGLDQAALSEALSDRLAESDLSDWYEFLQTTLRELFDRKEAWESLADHFTLNRVVEDLAGRFMLFYSRSNEYAIAWRLYRM
jgi:hypothetical protein